MIENPFLWIYSNKTLQERRISLDTEKKLELVRVLIDNVADDFNEEDILHMMLEKKISADIERTDGEEYTTAQKAADNIAHFAGSWVFIFSFTGLLLGWMVINSLLASRAFDAYPYILLNLVLSCVAAIQAPLIMMSQNRPEEKDRVRAENDYKVNLKSEFIVEDLHKKMDLILDNLEKIEEQLWTKEK